MKYYSHGSLAYDLTLFEDDRDRRPSARGERDKDKTAESESTQKVNTDGGDIPERGRRGEAEKRKSRGGRGVGRIIAAVVFGIAIAFIVVSIIHGQVQLTELNQEIVEAKAQLAEQQSVYTQLEMKVDANISTQAVEQYAKDKLKMSKAAETQKEYVNLSEGDKAEVSMSSEKSIFEAIGEAFSSLWS